MVVVCFRYSLKVPSNTGITINIYIVVCCVIDVAVQWKESGLEVDDELCSMLSRFPVVNCAALRVDGQTLPSFSYMSIVLLACSVLRVLSAHQNKHQDNTRHNGLVKRQCI